MTQEAMKLAIQLRDTASGYWTENEIPIIEKLIELLAQTQEPVAWMRQDGQKVTTASDRHNYPDYETRYSIPLYNTPPQRTWVGLTDEERQEIALEVPIDAVSITEAKLKEKNT